AVKKFGCLLTIVVLGMGLALLALWTCTVKIPADRVGVRTFLTSSGVEEVDHPAGYVMAIPGMHAVRLWDPTWTNQKETLHVRATRQAEAQKAMDEQLRAAGIEVRYVLLRNILYDPKFESQLLQKQLAGQQKSLEMSKGQLAGAQTQTELIKRNAEAEVKRID